MINKFPFFNQQKMDEISRWIMIRIDASLCNSWVEIDAVQLVGIGKNETYHFVQ